jgi:hypothetical protein
MLERLMGYITSRLALKYGYAKVDYKDEQLVICGHGLRVSIPDDINIIELSQRVVLAGFYFDFHGIKPKP